MGATNDRTVILGPEYDNDLLATLRDVLNELGGDVHAQSWGVGGSQELATSEVKIGSQFVFVEAETYIGLMIRGPADLVGKIEAMVTGRSDGPGS